MISGPVMDVLRKSCKYFCTAYLAGVDNNTCTYSSCHVVSTKSAVTSLVDLCLIPTASYLLRWLFVVWSLEVVASICYLGDTLSSGGGCELAIITHYQVTWKKFHSFCLSSQPRPEVMCTMPAFTMPCCMPVRHGLCWQQNSTACSWMTGSWYGESVACPMRMRSGQTRFSRR